MEKWIFSPVDFKKNPKGSFDPCTIFEALKTVTQGSHGGDLGKSIPFKSHKYHAGIPYIILAKHSCGNSILLKPKFSESNKFVTNQKY